MTEKHMIDTIMRIVNTLSYDRLRLVYIFAVGQRANAISE